MLLDQRTAFDTRSARRGASSSQIAIRGKNTEEAGQADGGLVGGDESDQVQEDGSPVVGLQPRKESMLASYYIRDHKARAGKIPKAARSPGSGTVPGMLCTLHSAPVPDRAGTLIDWSRVRPAAMRQVMECTASEFILSSPFEHRNAVRQLKSLPADVLKRYEKWKNIVEISDPTGLKEIKGFRDEPLRGEWKGHRSSRLNLQYRIIYKVKKELVLVQVVSVTPHDYRRK